MLRIRNLSRPPLSPVSFELADGECLVVTGASGSGKSLLLRAIADLDPSEGEVVLDSTDRASVPGPEWRRLVGYVAAEPGWWSERLEDHFADWESASALFDALSLPQQLARQPVSQLSTGERQRLAVLRALQAGSRVLLLDEPTAALDQDATLALEALVRQRIDQGLSVVWVTHDQAQAARLGSRRLDLDALAEDAAP